MFSLSIMSNLIIINYFNFLKNLKFTIYSHKDYSNYYLKQAMIIF